MEKKIKQIFKTLIQTYGEQGWWPITRHGEIAPSYCPTHKKRRLSDNEKLEIIFGSLLTQNTNWKNVEKALINLNKKGIINIGRVKRISKDQLANLIRSAGYYNQKAERLKIMAQFLKENK